MPGKPLSGQLPAEQLSHIKFKASSLEQARAFVRMCQRAGYRWPGRNDKCHAHRMFFFTNNQHIAWGYPIDYEQSPKRALYWTDKEISHA